MKTLAFRVPSVNEDAEEKLTEEDLRQPPQVKSFRTEGGLGHHSVHFRARRSSLDRSKLLGSALIMDRLLPPTSGALIDARKEMNETPMNSRVDSQSYSQTEKEKFIRYVESLGIHVNRRNDTELGRRAASLPTQSGASQRSPSSFTINENQISMGADQHCQIDADGQQMLKKVLTAKDQNQANDQAVGGQQM